MQGLGVERLSKSEVSRMCAGLTEQVEAFRQKYGGIPPFAETQAYVKKITASMA